jgi:hypothetical protein
MTAVISAFPRSKCGTRAAWYVRTSALVICRKCPSQQQKAYDNDKRIYAQAQVFKTPAARFTKLETIDGKKCMGVAEGVKFVLKKFHALVSARYYSAAPRLEQQGENLAC